MNLYDYPQVIANLQQRLFSLDCSLLEAQKIIAAIQVESDAKVAFSDEFRNDAQRKAARQKFLDNHPRLWEHQEFYETTKRAREKVRIELELRCNEFSVLKLQRRENIARLEAKVAV